MRAGGPYARWGHAQSNHPKHTVPENNASHPQDETHPVEAAEEVKPSDVHCA